MAKMNLDFLLSPETNSGNGDSTSGDRSRRADSAFSLDYIAPRRSSDDEKHKSSKHHRRPTDPSVHHARASQSSRTPHSSASKPPSTKDSAHTSSRSQFKSKKSKSPGSPSTHRPGSSSELKPHECRSCDKSFYKLEQLKRHDRLVHLNLRPFLCATCDLSFGTKQNMQVHLTTRKHRHRLETLQSTLHHSGHGSSSRQHR